MPPSENNPRFRQWSKLLFFALANLVFNALLFAAVLTILAQSCAWAQLPLPLYSHLICLIFICVVLPFIAWMRVYKSWRNTMLNYRLYGDRHVWTADLTGKQFGQVKQI